ncbi:MULTISPECIES: FAD-dependent oxidoreductase [Microbacterium]|uniref:CoA-disulfide reductase n=2 Tax=Microbacterium TaxID=33882 RepID=A0A7D7WE89_9MICO|nr:MULTISPECIES: FAD-dependent oxidoreductase [Microbacterium]KJL21310.1 Coenzyme A disulfide reductase [Microbacterium oxydans]MCT1364716.1 FAD-dependent oxidoreductase [Microbacterium sp. p3-SID131]MCT1377302.1 FAD-dependent oxidoreductase [Microbacterium sp. p3-SID337]QMU97219.1 CoA-disulfide reductase [Microbacterium esteraromaticum]
MHLVAIGGSDAGISTALRARELDPSVDVTVVVADAYPNFSICGIPYYFSREVQPWQSLAHRTHADLEATGMNLRLDTLATGIDVDSRRLTVRDAHGSESTIAYDELMVGTGASPSIAGIAGLDQLGPDDGVHLLHSMGDTFALEKYLDEHQPETAIIVGAGYVGLEMAEALTVRGLQVTQLQRGPEVLSTLDPELGSLVHDELTRHGVDVLTGTRVEAVAREAGRIAVTGTRDGEAFSRNADVVLVVVGVRPNTSLLTAAGATTGAGGAVVVDEQMRTGLPNVWAAGDGVVTHHRLLGVTYLPLGTTAHKQGRVAGENAIGGDTRFAGSLGTQVVKVFDVVAARTGLRDHEATAASFAPHSHTAIADDHKRYYPGATPISIRITGDTNDGRLLGAQLVGTRGAEISKRVDTYATALHHGMTVAAMSDLDLSYTPPLGSPWDAVQVATQAWERETRRSASALRQPAA